MRIATWNLERPSMRSWKKLPAQQAQMARVDADIWVLTETNAELSPGDGYTGVCSAPHPSRLPGEGEVWASVWWRGEIEPVDLVGPSPWRVAALVKERGRRELLVYGTVFPWHADRGDDPSAPQPNWEVHHEVIDQQVAEWEALRSAHPGIPMVVAGDLNQTLDGARYYGTRRGADAIGRGLESADLVCLTDGRRGPIELQQHHLIDHICVSRDLTHGASLSIECWEAIDGDGVRMSDHPGVAVDLGS